MKLFYKVWAFQNRNQLYFYEKNDPFEKDKAIISHFKEKEKVKQLSI